MKIRCKGQCRGGGDQDSIMSLSLLMCTASLRAEPGMFWIDALVQIHANRIMLMHSIAENAFH